MAKGFTHIRVGHAGAHLNHQGKRADSACATGGFYVNPTHGQTVDSSKPLNISWDATCLTTNAVDIYLYAPGALQSRIHMWQNVNFAESSYQATLEPKWWNASASATLQLSIVTSGSQPFLSPLPAGPVFTATYTAPTSGSTPASADLTHPDSGITAVNNFNVKHGPTKGGIAAAVIFPLLIVGLIVAAYLKIKRARGKEKRKRWSEAVDKRMSTISTDWKSMSAAGASAAIRNSMAIPGNRASSFSFGAIRPASTLAVEGGQAGIGAAGLYTHENASLDADAPQMSQLRPGIRASAFGERVSRVSFAADVRPSAESRRTVTSRAFHTSFIPPVPSPPESGDMSPTQTQGPLTLTPEDIRARIAGKESNGRPSMDEVMPALSMMRTGGEDFNAADGDYLFPPTDMPAPPTPTYPAPQSPIVGLMPMQPASVMSPDEMLRAYATRKATPGPGQNSPISFPAPAVSYNGNGMRTLYSPTTPNSASPMIPGPPQYRASAVTERSRYSDEQDNSDAYIGTAD